MATLSREEQLELVHAARRGDERAFERLYLLVEPILRRSLYRIVPVDDVDDVIQDTMLRAFRKLEQFQEEASFSTWCMTIGVNTALMRRRKLKRENEVIAASLDETLTNNEGVEYKAIDLGYEDRTFEQKLAFETVQKGLVELNEEQQIAILMQLDGGSLEEIAEAIGRSIPAAKSILYRGKNALEAAITGGTKREARLCKCGCGEEIAARGWPYKTGHAARKAERDLAEVPA